MRTRLLTLLVCGGIAVGLAAQQGPTNAPSPQTAAAAQPSVPISTATTPKGFVLEDATPVRLRINRTLSSADAHVGDTVDFEVLEDVNIGSTLVVQKGSLAFATVTEAQAKRRMARGGKLDINIDYVKLMDGEKAALRAVKDMKGGGHTGAMVGGMVATSLVFFPAAPFFLFMHGKDITIPKGTEVTAYVNGDLRLDQAKFQGGSAVADSASKEAMSQTSNVAATPASPGIGRLSITSVPDGGDIEVDGSFVGNAPSEVPIAEGEHTIAVKKAGFKVWERKLNISATSNVHLNAELEKDASQ